MFLSSPVLIDFRERGKEGQREGKRNIEKPPLTCTPTSDQVCVLTGDRTLNISVPGTTLQPTEPHRLALESLFMALTNPKNRLRGH